jgi:hypothetical protein
MSLAQQLSEAHARLVDVLVEIECSELWQTQPELSSDAATARQRLCRLGLGQLVERIDRSES